MRSYRYSGLVVLGLFVFVFGGCASMKPVPDRIAGRTFPSLFQAWNPIEMNAVSLATDRDRLIAAARHDLLWEEPASQLDRGMDLVLGAVWDHEYSGLATRLTPASRKQARTHRQAMLKINPNMLFLMEIRWKDAPADFLPADSNGWIRASDGSRMPGWTAGTEPYYRLNYQGANERARIVGQASVAATSGVYDGILLNSWGSRGENDPNAIALLTRIRGALGPKKLIVVNSDRRAPLPNSAPYVNGVFMEMSKRWRDEDTPQRWQDIRKQLTWFEENLCPPVVNCMEIQAGSDSDMRAGLALSLIFSDGYYLFAKYDNSDPSPDHLHEWFDLYDLELGRPTGPMVAADVDRPEGTVYREYEGGTVIYNPLTNFPITMELDEDTLQASTGEVGRTFTIDKGDGDILLKVTGSEAGN